MIICTHTCPHLSNKDKYCNCALLVYSNVAMDDLYNSESTNTLSYTMQQIIANNTCQVGPLVAFWEGKSTGDRWIPLHRANACMFDIFFEVRLNKWFNKEWSRR